MTQDEPLFDVVAMNLTTHEERIIASGKTEGNAEAIVKMAVMRRGVSEEFFKVVPARAIESVAERETSDVERCRCGYQMPCSKTVPITMCRARMAPNVEVQPRP